MMLGLISRQAPRLLRQPGSLIFRRCLADGAPAVALTFGSPSEVSKENTVSEIRNRHSVETCNEGDRDSYLI